MKRLFIFLSLMAGLTIMLAAQDATPVQKKSRAERKKEKMEKRLMDFKFTKMVLENKAFVLEAQALNDRYGRSFPVSSMVNFIEVDAGRAVIQTGNPNFIGFNGLGGITAQGRITNYEMIVNEKRNNFRVNFSLTTTIGMYDVQMLIDSSGGASATLYGMRGRSITYRGEVLPTVNSIVYKGTKSF